MAHLASGERLKHALVKGITTYIVDDTEESLPNIAKSIRCDWRSADGGYGRRRRFIRWR